jgi:hypothetical protein
MSKKSKKRLQEKTNFDPINNPDSMWSRQSASRKTKNGASIQQLLGIDYGGPSTQQQNEPMKMMDIVLQKWSEDADRNGEPFATDELADEDGEEIESEEEVEDEEQEEEEEDE